MLARAAVLAVLTTLVSLTGHVLAGGAIHVSGPMLLAALALGGMAVAAAEVRRSFPEILAVVLLAQPVFHLLASLGEGRVAQDGCLECPWHAARYDVRTGAMTRGPQGAFKPLAGVVKGTTGARALTTYPVTLRDGAIWLEG